MREKCERNERKLRQKCVCVCIERSRYDADQNGYLDPAELKDVMLDVYKSAIATLAERCAAAAEQAAAACAAVTEVDRRWMVRD